MQRILEAKNAIVGIPATATVLVSQVENVAPNAGWATVALGIISVAGLAIRLRYQDREGERTARVATLNGEVERLRKQVSTLEERNSLVVYTPPDTGSHATIPSLSVLLAEDHDALGFTESKALRKAGHRVRLVKTVAEAIREFNVEPPDALVVDLKLADGDGELVLKHARRSGLACNVVIVTGEVDEQRLAVVRRLGARVLIKPVNGDALLEAVRPDPSEPEPPILPRSDSEIVAIPPAPVRPRKPR